MGYLWTLVIVAVALIGLVVLVLAALGPLRRASAVSTAYQSVLRDKGGMLSARVAALKVLLDQRKAGEQGGEQGGVRDETSRSSAGI